MQFQGKHKIILCVFYLYLLFPGICDGGVLTGIASGADKIFTGAGAVFKQFTNTVCDNYPIFSQKDSNPIVKTNSGTVVGKYVKIFGIKVTASFLSIPYAKPPLGEYRFRPADPVVPWEGILQADREAPPCIQYSPKLNATQQSSKKPTEDCLVLNIFVPRQCCCEKDGKLQVFVWIHGGAFAVGSSASYDGNMLAYKGKVIVVTMNYRLGVFGFLKADPNEAPGNMGLTDQVLAIQWVRENIEFFGGDANKITLFGESAGADSISLHLISPMSRNLFIRAIMESGSLYQPVSIDTPVMSHNKANSIAEAVQCANESFNMDTYPNEVIQCLKVKNALTLAKAENTLRPRFGYFSQPSIGNEFLSKHPIEVYDSDEIAPVDILIGNLKDEGTLYLNLGLDDIFPLDKEPNLTTNFAETLIPIIFEMVPVSLHENISNFYLKNVKKDDSSALVRALQYAQGDFTHFCPTLFLAEKVNNVYVYWWTYLSSADQNADWVGAYHGSDVPYVFGFPFVLPNDFTPEDLIFSNYIIREFSHFARKGYPLENGNILRRNRWTKFSAANAASFQLSANRRHTIPFPRKEACEFWRPIFPTIIPKE